MKTSNFQTVLRLMWLPVTVLVVTLASSCSDEHIHRIPSGGFQGRIASIDMQSDGIYTFLYAKDKLTAITHNDGAGSFRYKFIRYEADKITVQEEGENNEEHTYILNDQGYAVSGTIKTASKTVTVAFTYSNDNYLTKIAVNMPDDSQFIHEIEYDASHNLEKITLFNEPNTDDEEDIEYTFTYGTDLNLGGKTIMPYVVENMDILFVPYYAGLLGKDPTNLFIKIDSVWSHPEYAYTFDRNGYISSIIFESDFGGLKKQVWHYRFE